MDHLSILLPAKVNMQFEDKEKVLEFSGIVHGITTLKKDEETILLMVLSKTAL